MKETSGKLAKVREIEREIGRQVLVIRNTEQLEAGPDADRIYSDGYCVLAYYDLNRREKTLAFALVLGSYFIKSNKFIIETWEVRDEIKKIPHVWYYLSINPIDKPEPGSHADGQTWGSLYTLFQAAHDILFSNEVYTKLETTLTEQEKK